jgi:CubicO group peptidase (beta-lactamase class C family)
MIPVIYIKPIMKKIFGVFIFLIVMQLNAAAQNGNPVYQKDIETDIRLVVSNLCSDIQVEGEPNWTLEERMKYYHVNGVSIAVIRNYKIAWVRGFGWADSAEQRLVTASTLFQAGSISKSLNGIGVLKLAQDGKLNLYEDINQYLKSWKFPYDSVSKGKKITTADLLSHTAGLTIHGFPGYEKGTPLPTIPQILDGLHPANTQPVRSALEPAIKEMYSGGGTLISQLIVQDITGIPYDKFMLENVLKPMGMSSSFFTQPPPAKDQKKLATGYYLDGKEVKGKYHIYPEQAAAGLWTNTTDLARYIIETQLALQGKSDKVLSQATTRLRLKPYQNNASAFGIFIDTIGGQVYFSHNGQDEGFVGRYVGSADDGNGVVVMTNTNDGQIINEIINSVAIIYKWKGFYKPVMTLTKISLDNAVLESYVGKYKNITESEGQYNLTPGSVFTIIKEGHHLKAQAAGQQMIDIYPAANDVFFPKTSDTDIKFVKDDKGLVTKLVIHQNGKFITCEKIK